MKTCHRLLKLYIQGQNNEIFREYFYFLSHEGYLFLDDSRMKIFTAAYRDVTFLNFFYKNLRTNDTDRYQELFPYVSFCGREKNYLRCDDRPIVFTAIVEDGTKLKIGGSTRTFPIQPEQFSMLSNGRLYHPSPFANYGLVKSALADKLFPLFQFDSFGYPIAFNWKVVNMSAPGAPRKPRHSTQSSNVVAQSHYPVDDQQIFCIKGLENVEDISADEKLYQDETYNMLVRAGVDPVWISIEDALKVPKDDPNFYVLTIFRGQVFEHLEKAKCKVLSTSLIRQCLQNGCSIPKRSHPVYSLHFQKVKVCFTGLTLERREHLSKLVRYMNGTAEKNLFPTVTHLVTDRASYQSDKYRAAKTKKLPIMKIEWIEEAWEKALQNVEEDFSHEDVIEKFNLPLFSKMVLCTSGIGGQDRNDLIRLIELYGGRSPGEMRRGECTHLLTENTVGAKYRKALEWGDVKVVTVRWVRKSLEQGYIQDESKFDPSKPQQTAKNSTQIPGTTAPKELDVSSIYGPLKHTLNSQILRENNISKKGKNEIPSNVPSPMPRTQSRKLIPADDQQDTCSLNQLFTTVLKGDFDFFEGCSIFVCGVDKSQMEKINRILDRCGATRVNSIERASHIVVASVKEGDRLTLIGAQKSGIILVRPDWLLSCINKRDLVCTEEYTWDPDATVLRAGTLTAASVVNNSRLSAGSTKSRPSSDVPFSNVITTVSDQLRTEPGPSNISTANYVFLDRTFRLHLLDSDLISHLQATIEDNAGRILEEDQDEIADYLVGSQVEHGSVPDPIEEKYKELVTENFVKHCVAAKKILNIRERPLFKPIPAVNGSQIFNDVVFGFVALGDIDKFTFIHLIKDYGGSVEASIVTRYRDGIKPCTHIVAGEECSKVLEFRKKLPQLKIVDPSWIIDSIINDKKMQEERYLFNNKAYGSYSGRNDDFWLSPSRRKTVVSDEEPHPVDSQFLDTPRAGNFVNMNDVMEIDFDEPPQFQKCATSTPKAPQHSRKSIESRFNPRIHIDGVTQLFNEIPSPVTTEEDSLSSINISKIGRMLSEAAVKTGKPPAELQRSVTEPVKINSKKGSVQNFCQATTPKRASSSKRAIQIGAKEDVSEEAALSSRLMKRQVDYLCAQLQVKREPDEATRSASDASQTTNSKRKRAHEMIDDSPTAPPPKRNTSLMELAVDWQPEQEHPDSEEIVILTHQEEERPKIVANIAYGESSIQEIHIGTPVKSVKAIPPPPKDRPSPRSSAPEIVLVDRTPNGKDAIPVRKSNSSSAKSKQTTSMIREPAMFSPEQRKVFLFTGVHIKDREEFDQNIMELGGQVASEEIDSFGNATHLICGRIVRGTKLMGCIASGRWVLKQEYLTESFAMGKFLKEDLYEWGHPSVLANSELDAKEIKIAKAAYRWRNKLKASQKKGVFSGWKVLLYCAKEKAAGVVPLLLAGDAEVAIREKLDISIKEYKPTHTIVVKSLTWNRSEMNEVIAAGSKVFPLDYLSALLLDDGVEESAWLHHDFKVWAGNVNVDI